MSVQDNDERQLLCILRHCERIERTVHRVNRDFTVFAGDRDFIDSTCLNILQIGEFANRLSKDFVSETSGEIPWRSIVGMRNIGCRTWLSQ